jgi:hypothetical protein
MDNGTLDSLADTLERKEDLRYFFYRKHEQLPRDTNANREEAKNFFRDHIVPLSKEIVRLRAELEQQQSQQLAQFEAQQQSRQLAQFKELSVKILDDMQRLERLEKLQKPKEFDAETHRREKLEQQRAEQRKEFDAETYRLETLRDEIGDSTTTAWQNLDHQIFSRYKNK